jgi:hypothetical protein
MNFNIPHKKIHSTNSNGCGPPKNWKKNFGPPQLDGRNMTFDSKRNYHHPRGSYTSRGEAEVEAKTNLCIACFTIETQTIVKVL